MLKLVKKGASAPATALKVYGAEADQHHNQLLNAYVQSHHVRNHSPRTIADTKRFLNAWFKAHGTEMRTLYTWEAMEPVHGRNRVAAYAIALKDLELANSTLRKYLGMLRAMAAG